MDEPTKPRAKRGAALASAIMAKATERGMLQKNVARELGFTEVYFSLLLSGDRWFGTIAEDKVRAIANFLDIPVISVLMLSEVVNARDFYRESTLEAQLSDAYKRMASDKRFTTCMPTLEEWDNASVAMKLFSAILYNDVSGKDFLEKVPLIQPSRQGRK